MRLSRRSPPPGWQQPVSIGLAAGLLPIASVVYNPAGFINPVEKIRNGKQTAERRGNQ
jgi:hypothetical protein